MSKRIDVSRIERAIKTLSETAPELRRAKLIEMALQNGGKWDLPSAGKRADGTPIYDPLIKSIEVFGVYAMAEDLEEIAKNWMIAANNIVHGDDDQAEVA